MKYVTLDNIQQGECLGRNIYSSEGRVLLSKGVPLTIGMISRLKRMGVNAVYLNDNKLEDIDIEEVVSEETRRRAIQTLAHSYQYIQNGKDFDTKEISTVTKNIVDEVMQNNELLIHLADIRTSDNQIFVHSVNVCIMSIYVAINFGLDRIKIQELAVGALLHDIGKFVKDQSNAKITAEEGDHNDHTWKGFNHIRKKKELSTLSAHVALQHHEHIDGTGTPRKLSGDDIHLYAKIVAVTNYYDHLISTAADGGGLHPFEACEKIMGLTNSWFDHEVVWKFLRSIALYPTGSYVQLTTGKIGAVIKQHKGLPQRPVIRIFDISQNSKYEDYDFNEIDLAKKTTVFIQRVLTD
ncbi:HD-GYP domain-containing protein [Anaerobacillus sp. MEB173]|uniref:HD-GYP domain-containing protein n=1 Tax=Anaerobacillus sp. MEB173 TaxID=3383345 RepID=UPI003F92B843